MTEESFEPPVPHPALRRLEYLEGSWEVKGATVESPMGPPSEVTGWETFAWMDGGFFLIHRWETTFEVGGQRVDDGGYEFFDYTASGRYRSHFFNSLGPYDDEGGSTYTGDLEGDALVVTGPARIIRRPNADGTVTVESLIPTGPDQWAPMMTYTLTKRGSGSGAR